MTAQNSAQILPRDQILPHELPQALDRFDGLRVLSLDCFDTLLWRDTHAPHDVFTALPQITPHQRIWAEKRARQAARFGRNRSEVSIGEIYAQLFPNASQAERTAAIEAEIAAEARHCFAFAPTLQLMRKAKARGLEVVIVSDTYLDAKQLRDLIALSAGRDVADLIDKVFSSSVLGSSKAGGLYREVLRKLSAKPHQILHIGDNHKADVEGVAPFGVNTLHLLQFGDAVKQRLRLEAAVSAVLHPHGGGAATTPQPHRAAIAAASPGIADPAEAFGFATLGPVLTGFERWLRAEAANLAARHAGTVHWLFLMRDGHLPHLVHGALNPEAAGHAPGHAIEISRFTAIASSFAQDRDVQSYIELELGTRPRTIARQLLIPEPEIAAILGNRDESDASLALLKEVRAGQRKRQIVKASRAMAARLAAHVRSAVNPAEGDVLMLVDLGYNGSVQNHVATVLEQALGVHVAGRYLLLREQDRPGLDKRGFIGSDHYDANTLEAMCGNVAVLEQVCTSAHGSVVDYTPDGAPLRRANDIKGRQSVVRERIQAGCLRFAAESQAAIQRAETPDEQALWRTGAAAVLARLMFLPTGEELAVLESFEHDVNLGTERTVPLFDRGVARQGLRERGLFYMHGSERMYLPAELHGHGLAPKLALFAQKRFGLTLNHADFADTALSLPVIFADSRDAVQRVIEATPTHDGYYLAAIPLGAGSYSTAVQFGRLFDWVQVERVAIQPVDDFLSEAQESGKRQFSVAPSLEGMEQVAPHLFRCDGEASFMLIAPPQVEDDEPMMLTVVFRPIAPRASGPVPADGPAAAAAMAGAGA